LFLARPRPWRRGAGWGAAAAGLACLLGSQLIVSPAAFLFFVAAGFFALRPVAAGSPSSPPRLPRRPPPPAPRRPASPPSASAGGTATPAPRREGVPGDQRDHPHLLRAAVRDPLRPRHRQLLRHPR